MSNIFSLAKNIFLGFFFSKVPVQHIPTSLEYILGFLILKVGQILLKKENLENILRQWEYVGQVLLKIRNPRKYS
jgi:ascorbate-specific PTS system EIIC-type component UlaA